MTIEFYGYPKCSTCRKASKWLKDNGINYIENHIVETPPTKEQLQEMHEVSGLELKKFFNTSGMKYRELGLKDKLSTMSEDEQLSILATDGMLIKRPIVFDGKKLTLGFKEERFEDVWKTS
ncbi:arsenate reductase [Psychrobacillus sp. OK028]|uniref:arsenate reductase family protein n=1 Tax=Psychrobacillus sp. OK028 TaxID=1884359 RepID=UPI000891CFC3|nr:arsenate reductase family protein [Psychrobacillus sp. OK028]SDO00008.1 arsenate reductase [Psychrobacillus sp. OK028]